MYHFHSLTVKKTHIQWYKSQHS